MILLTLVQDQTPAEYVYNSVLVAYNTPVKNNYFNPTQIVISLDYIYKFVNDTIKLPYYAKGIV